MWSTFTNKPWAQGLCGNCLEEVLSKPELNLEEGSAKVTLVDVYALFYILLKQSQRLKPGSKMCFDLKAFNNLPKKAAITFERKGDKLYAWVPEKRKKKSKLYLPEHKIVTVN